MEFRREPWVLEELSRARLLRSARAKFFRFPTEGTALALEASGFSVLYLLDSMPLFL